VWPYSMMMFLLFLAVGALAGVLAGLFGIGGGMVIVPVLVLTLAAQGVSEAVLTHIAVATSLATIRKNNTMMSTLMWKKRKGYK